MLYVVNAGISIS